MDYKSPYDIVKDLIQSGAIKSKLAVKDILIRGFLSGAFLAFSTILAFTVAIQSQQGYIGAIAFPVGFAMIILLGLELVTGNFAIIPMAVFAKQTSMFWLVRNWTWAFLGNLMGCTFLGLLFSIYITKLGHHYDAEIVQKIVAIAEEKTLVYKNEGSAGLLIVFVKAILCNWMVTMGVVMGNVSTSTTGKILALWLPVFTFFTLGLEHSVVNMFVIPTAILLKANISLSDWWWWNQIPVTIGNCIGGAFFTGALLYFSFGRKR
ncbi:MAG TPA: formate/nitrite transporter family protein [Niabella sp.]|nr:formate/nitrite transporter family protein [Niabella sp.]HQW14241.1 formate/nitrite transporter family protein [Niabella sp.]HQX19641.1 formate/nitrite transporter family protein [Niabella sp.]HQX39925.1 formate/nitrite transporter family protein [Niabella sp.]HRB06918.1 formate/nitrite transporter family protein [Niabella sp.]